MSLKGRITENGPVDTFAVAAKFSEQPFQLDQVTTLRERYFSMKPHRTCRGYNWCRYDNSKKFHCSSKKCRPMKISPPPLQSVKHKIATYLSNSTVLAAHNGSTNHHGNKLCLTLVGLIYSTRTRIFTGWHFVLCDILTRTHSDMETLSFGNVIFAVFVSSYTFVPYLTEDVDCHQ